MGTHIRTYIIVTLDTIINFINEAECKQTLCACVWEGGERDRGGMGE